MKSDYESIDTAVKLLFNKKNQSNVKALPPYLIECNQTEKYNIIYNISHEKLQMYERGRWSMLEYNHAETKHDFFNSDNSCFDNVRNSTMDQTLSLVTCKMTVDNACKTKVCVPFCCGNIYVYKELRLCF